MALTGDGWSRRGGMWVPGPTSQPLPPMIVVSPPFVALLVAMEHGQAVPFWDISDWSLEPAGNRRPVSSVKISMSAPDSAIACRIA